MEELQPRTVLLNNLTPRFYPTSESWPPRREFVRLGAGANEIRTVGPTCDDETFSRGKKGVKIDHGGPENHTSQVGQRFDSAFLQRRVRRTSVLPPRARSDLVERQPKLPAHHLTATAFKPLVSHGQNRNSPARNRQLESSSLQQTVRLSLDFSFLYRKAGSCRGVRGPVPSISSTCRARPSPDPD